MPATFDQIANLDAELDQLDDAATTAEVWTHSKDYDPDIVAASAARRAINGGGGAGGLQVASVTVSSAELLALPTPVEIVPAPGAGRVVVPVAFNAGAATWAGGPVLAFVPAGTPYTLGADPYLVLYHEDDDPDTVFAGYVAQTGLLDQSIQKIALLHQPQVSGAMQDNKALLLTATGTGPTPSAGNGALVVNVPYYVAQVA